MAFGYTLTDEWQLGRRILFPVSLRIKKTWRLEQTLGQGIIPNRIGLQIILMGLSRTLLFLMANWTAMKWPLWREWS